MLKDNLLAEFEKNRDSLLSGQQLADLFSVSRNAIWKAIKSLREEGHEIESIPQKGYRLKNSSDVISKEGILTFLGALKSDIPEIYIHQSLDSTNNEAKRIVSDNAVENAIIIAKEQTLGRGRQGHNFYSPADTGLYLSIILKPNLEINQSVTITLAVAVAIVRAIKKLTGKQLKIKWVNDLFYNDKKVCGILTEAITDLETGAFSEIIIGIGLNICTKDFPKEIAEIAGSLEEFDITKNEFIATIYNEVSEISRHLGEDYILEEYRKNCIDKTKIML